MSNQTDFLNLAANTANLAMNAAQLEQLSANKALLSQLLYYEAEKNRQTRSEDQMKQLVFDGESAIQETRSLIASNPKRALIEARLIVSKLRAEGVDPSRVSQFADKDRVRIFLESAAELLHQADAALSRDAVKEVDTALRLTRERPKLERLIAGTHANETFAAAEPEYLMLNTRDHKRSVAFFGLGILAIVLLASTNIGQSYAGFGILLAAIMALFAPAVMARNSISARHEKLDAMKKSLLSESEMKQLRDMFPVRTSSAEYEALLAERDTQIARLLT